ncbi:hypothetical protein [Alkalicoccus urumqiensis]|uniref:Uncharacterized protein n=1 Tax=Alkalicoccus urumqiensis TaxID=1548213 RepID=A0A2P6MGW0_ALKUR|nr:hypothetical protein [Alkalicoccus urumqiensis]PRO65526.1 hypothetical protein C6I21_08330 [Alkalicoccus urumqiensis]
MKPLPFTHTWPYEKQMGEIYVDSCPYCGETSVLTHMKQSTLDRAKEGIKSRIHFACCHEVMVVLHADDDYFWADEPLR